MYLFDNDLTSTKKFMQNPLYIQQQLAAEGFPPYEIHQAISWLKELQQWQESESMSTLSESQSQRVFSASESHKFTKKARDLLMRLEKRNVITPWHREVIIDRAMAIEALKINESQIKWIVLMVLYHYQQENMTIDWLEHILSESLTMH